MKTIIILISLVCLHLLTAEAWYSRKWGYEKSRQCYLSISQKTSRCCRLERAKELVKKRVFYKMSGPKNRLPFPRLDQPTLQTIGYFKKEQLHSEWSYLYFDVGGKARRRASNLTNIKYARTAFTSYSNYTRLENEFKDEFLKGVSPNKHFKYAGRSYKYFIDLMTNNRFKKDEYFAQLRLTGLNPMAIRRVTIEDESETSYCNLLKRLNKTFNWENAVTSITKDESIGEAIMQNKVYVVEYPALEGLKQMPDYLANFFPFMKMRNTPAHLALFAVGPDKKLRVVAIQNSTTAAGHVHTPRDGLLWEISKAELHINDIYYASNVEHLLKTHFKMEPICIAMHRHLSKFHPLHQILQYHCRGLIPVNAFGLVSLLANHRTYRSLFSYGNDSAIDLLLKEYRKMVWDDVDLEVNIKKRGMNDRKQIPYYPYRDDGRLVNGVLRSFAEDLILMYYKRNYYVRGDFELQKMIGELAQRRGSKNANKISKVKGLPSSFKTRGQLIKFVRQILWIVVQHSVFSYPVADYFLPPLFASKLYESSRNGHNTGFIQMQPGPLVTILQASLGTAVATLRYDSMFSYWKHLKSRKLQYIVKKAYKKLAIIQHRINMRNKKRYQRGQMTNPYMMRDWLPSSICT